MARFFSGIDLSLGLKTLFRRRGSAVISSRSALQLGALPGLKELLERPDSLPAGCADYFLPAPLESEELLVGRAKELEGLETVFNDWQAGQPASVAVIGPQGCGKTSLINCFLKKRPQRWEICRGILGKRLKEEKDVLEFFRGFFDIESGVEDVEALIARLEEREPRIMVLEGAHHLLLRVIGGRKALEIFMYVLLRTRRRHFWVLSCRRLPWLNMDRHVGISRFFSHVLELDLLPEEKLRAALEVRLKRCGLEVFFYRSREELEQQRHQGGNEQEEKENAFYRALLANSGRNFYSLLYFFLLCSRYEMKTQSLLVYSPEHLETAFVKEMDRAHLLALAELAGHGVLSASEHRRIFRTDRLQSQTLFEFLEQTKLIEPVAGGKPCDEKSYDLSPLVHHAIKTALEQINLLY